MVYRVEQGVKPKKLRRKILGGGLLGIVVVLALAAVYAGATGKLSSSSGQAKISSKKAGATAGVAASKAATAVAVSTATCTGLFPPKHTALTSAAAPELRKLAQYEQVCNGALADRSSFFVSTPATTGAAVSDASDAARKLKEYASLGIKPLVFMEPSTDAGANIDLAAYSSGAYDVALDKYFASLRSDGVTDAMMGMWVAIPEGNIPDWTTTDPAIYTACVTKTIKFQKRHFPRSQAAIMLDSQSYPVGATWGSGHYVSLLPYVQKIPKGLVDSFGLQGFPWAPQANVTGQASLYAPASYLRTDFAAEAAHALGVKNIWFNTGTFKQMYTNSSAQTVTASPVARAAMLSGVIAQAKVLQGQGFSVDIHLFAEDKSSVSEAIDWSYWKTAPGNDANTAVFTSFAHDAAKSNIPLWLFDSAEH